jgi:hypothetical protein
MLVVVTFSENLGQYVVSTAITTTVSVWFFIWLCSIHQTKGMLIHKNIFEPSARGSCLSSSLVGRLRLGESRF